MKNLKIMAVMTAMLAFSGAAFADGMMFEPVDVNYTPIEKPAATAVSNEAEASLIQGASTEKFENAILQLDSVQVELRNTYLTTKEQYQQVDAQYQAVKAERKAVAKNIRALEKKIKQIESTKSKIRKTMQ